MRLKPSSFSVSSALVDNNGSSLPESPADLPGVDGRRLVTDLTVIKINVSQVNTLKQVDEVDIKVYSKFLYPIVVYGNVWIKI